MGLEFSASGSDAYFGALEKVNPIIDRLLTLLLSLPYFMIMELLTGKTIGKLLTSTVVVDRFGNKPQNSDIIKRSFARLIPFDALSYLGTIPRGWHGTLSDTYVVEEKAGQQQFKGIDHTCGIIFSANADEFRSFKKCLTRRFA